MMSNPVYRVAGLVVCFGTLFGFGISSIAGVLETLAGEFHLDVAGQELLVSILVIACFFGAVAAAPLSSRLGRKPVMFLATALALAGYGVILSGPEHTLLLAARVVLGLSIGLSSMVVPMYAAEATAADRRGAVVALFQLAITGGILLAYADSLFFLGVWSWSEILGVGIIPAVIVVGLLMSLPESPRWLASRGKSQMATLASARLALGTDWQPEPSGTAPHNATTVKTGHSMAAVLALCGGLFILQNLSGIDGILYYAPHIFQTLGFAPGTASLAATFGLGLINFISTLVALRLVDSAGRRPLLLWGAALMVAGMALVIVASILIWPWASLAGLGLFILAFAVSLGPLPYVMMSELFPASIRESGIAAASSISWLFNALIAFTFLSVGETIGLTWTMAFFMLVCALSFLIGLVYLPETRQVPLEAIERNVMAGKRLRDLGSH